MSLSLVRFAVTLLATITISTALGADWPCWRGPNYDGLSSETGFKKDWQETPPKLWEAEIGSAFSGLSCVGGKVYTCGTIDNGQVLFCFDARSGRELWKTPFERGYKDSQGGDGTRATPTVHGGKIYIQGGWGRVVCLDAETGKEVWRRDFEQPPQWGYSASVLIDGNRAITMGNNSLVALDKDSGKLLWDCPDGVVGYATPYPFALGGQRFVVGFMGKQVLIADLENGQRVWNMPWETSWDVNAATPVFSDGLLFLSSGYQHGSTLLRLERLAGELKSSEVWQNKSIRAKFQTPVLHEGFLYTSDEVGLKCVEFKTGEEKWSRRGTKHGTLVIADGHMIVLTEEGGLLIGAATPKGFEPKTEVRLQDGRHWTVPTLYEGRLYIRNLERAACFDLTTR